MTELEPCGDDDDFDRDYKTDSPTMETIEHETLGDSEVDFEVDIKNFELSEEPSPPSEKRKTVKNQNTPGEMNTEGMNLDNELKRLEIESKKLEIKCRKMDVESKKLDIQHKKLLIRKLKRNLEVDSDLDCDPFTGEM